MQINAHIAHKPGSFVRVSLSVVFYGGTSRATAERKLDRAVYLTAAETLAELGENAGEFAGVTLAVDSKERLVTLAFGKGSTPEREQLVIAAVRAALSATQTVAFNRSSAVDQLVR